MKEGKRITQIQTDLGREFTHLDELCLQHLWHYAKTSGYNPQSTGTAESGVNITKTLTRRLLVAAKLPEEFWPPACQYALESYHDKLNNNNNKMPPFGTTCIVKRLKPEGDKTACEPRGVEGQLVYFLPTKSKEAWVWTGEEILKGLAPQPLDEIPNLKNTTWKEVQTAKCRVDYNTRTEEARDDPPIVLGAGENGEVEEGILPTHPTEPCEGSMAVTVITTP